MLFKLTLAARERLFGADHDSTLNSRANLAAAFRATGRVSEAIPLLEQTVAGRERVLGADHPDVRAARDNLAAARQEKDQTDDDAPARSSRRTASRCRAAAGRRAVSQSRSLSQNRSLARWSPSPLRHPMTRPPSPSRNRPLPRLMRRSCQREARPLWMLSAAVAAAETGSQAPPEPCTGVPANARAGQSTARCTAANPHAAHRRAARGGGSRGAIRPAGR